MPITVRTWRPNKATKIDETTYDVDVRMCNGIYLYVDYQRGTEDKIRFSFYVRDHFDNSNKYYLLLLDDYTPWQPEFDGSFDKFVLPVPFPRPADIFRFHIDYIGSDLSNPGTLDIFVNINSEFF